MHSNVRRRLADRMWQWRNATYVASAMAVLVATVVVFVSISTPASLVEISTEPTFFDADRAFRASSDLSALYPNREIGSKQAAGGTEWYTNQLAALQIPFTETDFQATVGKEKKVFRNVEVVFPGTSSDTILVTAPREPSDQPRLSPLADATGTAVLLDLIQVFAGRPHEKTMVFLSTEGGTYGGLSVEHYLDNSPRRENVAVMLSLRGVGKERRDSIQSHIAGPNSSTPGWYVHLASGVLKNAGLNLQLPPLTIQIARHSLALYQGEQAAGLRNNIPALTLYDTEGGDVTSAGLDTQGTALERLILSLDGGTKVPSDPGTSLVLGSGRFVTNRALSVLGVLMLLPSTVMALAWLAVTHLRPDAWMRHLRNVLSFSLPPTALAILIWLASLAGILPRFAGKTSPVAAPTTSPDIAPTLLLIAAGIALFIASRHHLGYLRPQEPRAMTEIAKLSLGLIVLLAGLALLAAHSPFMLITGLTMAWVWPLVSCFAVPGRPSTFWRSVMSNSFLLLGGLFAPFALYAYLITSTDLNLWTGWWFLLVQATSGAYGIQGPAAMILLLTALFLLMGVKQLRLIPMETLEAEDDLTLVEAPSARARRVRAGK